MKELSDLIGLVTHIFEGDITELRQRRAIWINYFRGCGNVLDVGCGDGYFLEMLSEQGITCEGLELDHKKVESARKKGLTVYESSAQDFVKKGDKRYGGIFCGHIIEHLNGQEAVELIYHCSRLLAPGGRLVILTPNYGHPLIVQNFWLDITHVRPYPRLLLERILEKMDLILAESGEIENGMETYVVAYKPAVCSPRQDIGLGGTKIPSCELFAGISGKSFKGLNDIVDRLGEFKDCPVVQRQNSLSDEGKNTPADDPSLKKTYEELRNFGVTEECLKHAGCPTVSAIKSLARRLNITWESPLLDLSGYAAMCRNAVIGLDDMGVSVRVKPIC